MSALWQLGAELPRFTTFTFTVGMFLTCLLSLRLTPPLRCQGSGGSPLDLLLHSSKPSAVSKAVRAVERALSFEPPCNNIKIR